MRLSWIQSTWNRRKLALEQLQVTLRSSDWLQLWVTIKCWILPAQDYSSLVKVENRLIWPRREPLKTNLTSETTPSTTTRPRQDSKQLSEMKKVWLKVSPSLKRKITRKETWSSFWTKLEVSRIWTNSPDLKQTVGFTTSRLRSELVSVSSQHPWLPSFRIRQCK